MNKITFTLIADDRFDKNVNQKIKQLKELTNNKAKDINTEIRFLNERKSNSEEYKQIRVDVIAEINGTWNNAQSFVNSIQSQPIKEAKINL